jgi:hypothetical protein
MNIHLDVFPYRHPNELKVAVGFHITITEVSLMLRRFHSHIPHIRRRQGVPATILGTSQQELRIIKQ